MQQLLHIIFNVVLSLPGINVEFYLMPPCRFCSYVCPMRPFVWRTPLMPLFSLVDIVYCVWVSWFVSSLSLVWRIFWLIVGTCARLSVGIVVPIHISSLGFCAHLVHDFFVITHVQLNLWFINVVLMPPSSVFGNSECFELCFSPAADPQERSDTPLTTLQVYLIRLISSSFCDQLFWS